MPIEEAERLYFGEGDRGAFDTIVLFYMDALISFIYKTVGDFSLAEDIAQECFIKLWVKPSCFSGKSTLKTFLYTMGHNKALNAIRKLSRSVAFEFPEFSEGNTVLEDLLKSERDRQLWNAIGTLSDTKREIVYLRYFEQASYGEIEKILGLPTKRLYKLVKQAKEELRDALFELDGL